MTESLTLKWGTLKRWKYNENSPFHLALEKYFEQPTSMSAMLQRDTPDQTQYILEAIDACDGEIWNDWEGTIMTKEEAKKYVTEYGK